MCLPSPSGRQAYCNVSALEGGELDILDSEFFTPAIPGQMTTVPSLAFLLQHATNGTKFVFDLGIRKDWDNYPPTVAEWIRDAKNTRVEQDVVESLAKGGTTPDDIDYVCISHCHWDHTGDTTLFKKSTFLVGGLCRTLLTPGYPSDPKAIYPEDIFPEGRTIFYDTSDWKPIGPFPRALDFFEDGSLYIVDCPGHLPGHVNILARTSPDGGWIYLAGDSAHNWKLVTLEAEIATGNDSIFGSCMHVDKEAAEATIRRIHALTLLPRTRVLLAHDEPFYLENKNGEAFWPGKIPTL